MTAPYEAPLALIRAAIDQAARQQPCPPPGYDDALGETADAVLEGISRLARDVLSPLNRVGDAAPSRLGAEGVVTPAGFREAYRRFCADGWPTLCAPARFGGQALPMLLGAAATETWGGANLAFAMCPEAATGAVEALRLHASASVQQLYLPRIVSGEWTASMCLTEPHAGSDLSTVRTLAEPDGESWRLTGRKIFISWGDHDFSDNIVHLVLARTPGAPHGLKGISLFVVPKYLRGAGPAPQRNDTEAVSLEHKMGIRASPTCVMALGERGGARGWLVGPLHAGVACLFAMMNHMRIGVALHSTGLAERAWQLARAYAEERRQGRDAAGAQRRIIEHADVRRMLLTMKSLTHAARCLAYCAAATLDLAQAEVSRELREQAQRRLALLTPIVKAWCSDIAVEVSSLGVQVHGGTGYVDDSEISQVYRDARIGPIFEGTNYIQAHDLLARKVIRDGGAALGELLDDVEGAARGLCDRVCSSAGKSSIREALAEPLLAECAELRRVARTLVDASRSEPELAGCVAYPFLQWLAVVAGGWQWVLAAQSTDRCAADGLGGQLVDCARFYGAHVLPRARTHAAQVESGTVAVLSPRPAQI
jgi:3-(methylsulfanyl)propanoyl-CoA dehydrogenase